MGLEVLVVGTSSLESSQVGEEQLPAEGVERFALLELGVDPAPVLLAVEVAEDGDGLDDPPIFLDGSGEVVLSVSRKPILSSRHVGMFREPEKRSSVLNISRKAAVRG